MRRRRLWCVYRDAVQVWSPQWRSYVRRSLADRFVVIIWYQYHLIRSETSCYRNMTINACLTPLCTVHGKAIVTVEGLGNVKNGLHPVQERIAKSHGTQCGFCTPGFVMSMYTLLRNNPEPSEEDMETAFQGKSLLLTVTNHWTKQCVASNLLHLKKKSGNLCRCTGYRPILDGYRSFCKVENCCRKTMGPKSSVCQDPKRRAVSDITFDPSEFRPYDPSQDPIFPPELKVWINICSNQVKHLLPAPSSLFFFV